ncbi:hypothetical protein G7Y89_g242 [Cudoniella acicularis]|uniref:Uncharacterized protein n=1 Tax=Cudoniella acicularis TaxID=354080 RepID=A0A8H4RYD1_9HELO|nr:hypothetical protein G7Y89_g242 [Cudoniella acicularis]
MGGSYSAVDNIEEDIEWQWQGVGLAVVLLNTSSALNFKSHERIKANGTRLLPYCRLPPSTMEYNYMSNPAIKICLEQIEPGSTEKEVQNLWENTIWTTFPASDHWMNQTKYKQGATEPDNKVMKVIHYNAGWAPIDVLVVELKRLREDISFNAFNGVACNLLDDHMAESTNPAGTTLFGAVGIGTHVQFYQRKLPRGNLETRHPKPLHFEADATTIQEYFNHFKLNIPQALSDVPVTSSSAGLCQAPLAHPGQGHRQP